MKYSEYLKLVKAHTVAPDELGDCVFAPNRKSHPICYANGDVRYFVTGVDGAKHYHRVNCAIDLELRLLREKLPVTAPVHAMYPAQLAAVLMHQTPGLELHYHREWNQVVRHELLDKWIAEAELEEQS